MKTDVFVNALKTDFFTGVPDSQLKPLCNYLMNTYGIDPEHHLIAVNEGNCVALAAGYHLATGNVPVVYLQNSGEGNIINPVASLLHEQVYDIPMIFVIGWRGEPGVHDEPQHIWQGQVTLKLMEDMGISTFVLSKSTTEEELQEALNCRSSRMAIIVRKGALTYDVPVEYSNGNHMLREEIIRHIVQVSDDDPIISTTGKASRELFEIREANKQGHGYDFLTVGSMGHSSSIALGVAIQKPERKIWCIDGDGAALMHMGALAVIGSVAPKNLIHVVINNGAHETVGGMPTVASKVDLTGVAKACGYPSAIKVNTFEALDEALQVAKASDTLSFLEVACAIGAREDLGRPTTSAVDNKQAFMNELHAT